MKKCFRGGIVSAMKGDYMDQILTHHLAVGWSWEIYLTVLYLTFLICKMGIIAIIPTSYHYREDELI